MSNWVSGSSNRFRISSTDGTNSMAYGTSEENRILSRPIRVFWAGWETDTFKLQQSGWKIAVKQDMYRDYYEFLFRNDFMNLTALSAAMQIHQLITDHKMGGQYAAQLPPLVIEKVAPTIEILRDARHENNFFDDFKMIDARPRMESMRVSSLQESCVFAYAIDQAEEVVVDRADMTVVDHLKAIKELQSDEQKRLREKARQKRDRSEEPVKGSVILQLTEYR